MSDSIVKVQVPMQKSLRDALVKLAEDRGFDSIQAYFRFVATNDIKGRKVTYEEWEPWPAPSPELAARWDREVAESKEAQRRGEIQPWTSADEAMEYLNSL